MLHRGVDAIDDPRSDDLVQVFRVPVLLARDCDPLIKALHCLVPAHLAARVEQRAHDRFGAGPATIEQHRFGRAAHAGPPQLCVQHDLARHRRIGIAIDVDVAVALQMSDDRHARFLLHALDQTAPAARHDDVDEVHHAREHVAHRGAVGRRHDLDRGLGQAGGAQSGDQACVNGAARVRAFRAAAQNHRVAGFQAQRACIGGDVRTALVNDTDYAERHAHALDAQAVGTRPGCDDDADRIGQRRDVFDAACHGRDAFLVERETIHHRVGKRPLRRRLQIATIGFEDRGALLANLGSGCGECSVLRRSTGAGQGLRRAHGGAPQ